MEALQKLGMKLYLTVTLFHWSYIPVSHANSKEYYALMKKLRLMEDTVTQSQVERRLLSKRVPDYKLFPPITRTKAVLSKKGTAMLLLGNDGLPDPEHEVIM